MTRRPTSLFRATLAAAAAAAVATALPACASKPNRLFLAGGKPPTALADVAFDQIAPPVDLPPPAAPTGVAADRAPVDALVLYAQGRAALDDGDRAAATALLERAAVLDPDSYSIWHDLGWARGWADAKDARAVDSIDAYRRAADLDPTRLDAQLDLAKQLLATGNLDEALRRLRLAVRTPDYEDGGDRAAEADFLLAHALREAGYDRAALERFELLTNRLEKDDRGRFPALGGVASTRVYLQIGDLQLRRGKPADALASYRRAEATLAGRIDVEVLGRIVQALLAGDRRAEALAVAADAVRRANASPASVALLRDAYALAGRSASAADALGELHRKHPDDLPILFALCDTLTEAGRAAEARQLLAAAGRRSPGDPALLARRAAAAPDAKAAVLLVVDALARFPDLDGQLDPVWRQLVPEIGTPPLTPAEIGRLAVPAEQVPARLFVESEVARRWPQSGVAAACLSDGSPAMVAYFAPAYRAAAAAAAADDDLPPAVRARRIDRLADKLHATDMALVFELKTMAELCRGDGPAALAAAREAEARGARSPAARLTIARAFRAAGDAIAAEDRLRKIVEAAPAFAPAYAELLDLYDADEDDESAERVLTNWSVALPADPEPTLRRAHDLLAEGRPDAAELVLAELEQTHPWNAGRLDVLHAVYKQTNRGDKFAALIEQALGESKRMGPGAVFRAGTALARHYIEQSKPVDAARVLELIRPAAAGEPDRLVALAELHLRTGGEEPAIQVLKLALDADSEGWRAAVMLSGLLAERRLNLQEAETLARAAVATDRQWDRPSAVAAVGWVYYCQGRYADARATLEKAVAMSADPEAAFAEPPATRPADAGRKVTGADPLTLDRLGDALYRLGDRDAAGRSWDQARSRLGDPDLADSTRPDLAALRLTLPRKIQRLRNGQEVPVAAARN